MSGYKQHVFMQTFAKLKQRVIIAWPVSELLYDIPDNVLALNWLPQQDILAHPSVTLLITHGGLNSINEAKFFGVPVLGIPIFGDQQLNMNLVVEEGSGIIVPFADCNEETFFAAINEILTNGTYVEKANRLSVIYSDRPLSAKDTAIYWIEYVLRHFGAKHIQSPAVHYGFFQFYSLDIIGGALFMVIRVYFTFKTVRYGIRKIKEKFGKKDVTEKPKLE